MEGRGIEYYRFSVVLRCINRGRQFITMLAFSIGSNNCNIGEQNDVFGML